MARTIRDKDIKLIWGPAAARCSICRLVLVLEKNPSDDVATLGQMAHIVAHGKGKRAPRADPNFDETLRDTHENLILLCDNHHTEIDEQPNSYTVHDLRKLKRDHEKWVTERLAEEITNITFLELEIVTRAFVTAPDDDPEVSFTLTRPLDKMNKNDLFSSRRNITLGLAHARTVEAFVSHFAVTQPSFPEELKAGFVKEYNSRYAEGLRGDALFEAMHEFASGGDRRDFKRQAAGLSVLAYLFEKCEVFLA